MSDLKTIFLLVEGDGEEKAAPLLLRRILGERVERYDFSFEFSNAHGVDKLHKDIAKWLERTRRAGDRCKGVLILRDVERDNCARTIAADYANVAIRLGLSFPVVIVCAVCEYESWFLASLPALKDRFALDIADYDGDPEQECGAKGWLKRHMPNDDRTYQETRDQVKMTAHLDLDRVYERCRSFRRMAHAVAELIAFIDEGHNSVTPGPVE